jgi:hypothetical protein
MIDELNQKLQEYSDNWEKLVAGRSDKQFFSNLKPVAAGWKVADEAEYKKLYNELRTQCDRIVETWMNGRWIAKMHLKDTKLTGSIEIVKLMQRRPNSGDALGLDHVDFYSPAVLRAEEVLAKETGLKWTHESNDVVDNYDWISIWFNGTEAKLKAGTVIDIVITELQEIGDRIKS